MLAVNDGIAKHLTETYSVGQVLALRGTAVVVLLVASQAILGRLDRFRVVHRPLQLTRGGLMSISTYCFVTGLALLPLADATAISFAGPILTTAMAVPLLGETVGWRRGLAVCAGFAGVLVMLQPTPDAFQLAALAPLGAAFFGGLRDIVTRKLGSTSDGTLSILLVSTTMVTALGWGSFLVGDWAPLNLDDLAFIIISGILVGLAQALTIEAFRWGEVGLVSPFKYTGLVWAVVIGFIFWGDWPTGTTWIGVGLVVGSGVYIMRRETALARLAKTTAEDNRSGEPA